MNDKEYKESIKALTKDQRLELVVKLLNTLGFKRIRYEEKRGKAVIRFEHRDL